MGSYITFGIVCDKKIGKERFLNNIFNIIVNNKEYITNLYFKYPLDENCEYWQESQESILNLRNILEKCFELDLAELKFDYIKEDKIYSDILLSIKHVENDSYGLLCSIPERYFEYSKGINNIELKKNNKLKIVTEKDIIEVIKSKTNMPVLEIDNNYIVEMKNRLKDIIIGQEESIDELLNLSKRININNNSTSILLCGKSGIGKTTLAKEYSKLLRGSNVIKLDMSEFTESHSISKIVGSPPGYVGYSDTKTIFDEIKDKSNGIIILDEIEKCHKSILNLFLKAIDEGVLNDSRGRSIKFENRIIIMTTNVDISDNSLGFSNNKCNIKNKLKNVLGSELINKLNKIIVLNSIDDVSIKEIILKRIDNLQNKYNINLEISDEVIAEIINMSDYEISGVRKIDELINTYIEDILFDEILNNNKNIVINSLNLVTN